MHLFGVFVVTTDTIGRILFKMGDYSHSIVAGGLELMS